MRIAVDDIDTSVGDEREKRAALIMLGFLKLMCRRHNCSRAVLMAFWGGRGKDRIIAVRDVAAVTVLGHKKAWRLAVMHRFFIT